MTTRRAIESYGGVLLPDCDDYRVVAVRKRVRRLAVEALAAMADAEGRDDDVVERARHLLGIDALHEPACRLLMQVLARRGERREAHTRALTLHRRLGRCPSPSVLRGLALRAVVTCHFERAEDVARALVAIGGTERTARVEREYVLGVTTFAVHAILAAFEPEHPDLEAVVVALDGVTSAMHIDYFALVARLLTFWRRASAGEVTGVSALRRATDRLRREQPPHLRLGHSFLARGYQRCGDPQRGRVVVAEALEVTARSGQRHLLAELLRIDAELLALSGNEAAGADRARRAVDTAVATNSPRLPDRALATFTRLSRGLDRERLRNALGASSVSTTIDREEP